MYKLFTGNDLLRKSTRILWIDSQVHAQTLSKSTECRSVKAYDQHSNKHIYVYCCFCNDQCTRTDCEPTLNLSNRELRVSFEYDVLVFTNCASILENKNLDVTRHVDPHVFDDSSYKTQGFKHSAFYLHYSQQGFKTLNSIDRILGIVFMLMVLIASNFKVMYKVMNFDLFSYLLYLLDSTFKWLGNNPGGLKLHNQTIEVVAYYCAYILKIWYSVIKLIFSYPVILVQCLSACSAITGICLVISLFRDLLFIFQFYIFIFQLYSSKLLLLTYTLLKSLIHTFIRGQRNPRTGIEDPTNWFYIDELIMFALALLICLFLLPTLIALHLTFLVYRLIFVSCDWLLTSCLYKPILKHSSVVEECDFEIAELKLQKLTILEEFCTLKNIEICLLHNQLIDQSIQNKVMVVHDYPAKYILLNIVRLREISCKIYRFYV